MAIPGFVEESVFRRMSWTFAPAARRRAVDGIRPAGCSYYYGFCAGPGAQSCEFLEDGGICVGPGWAPVTVTCDDGVSLTDAWCGA
jgi:hypothetical protein